MRAWGLKGTPTTLLLDRMGRLRHHALGAEADLVLGLRVPADEEREGLDITSHDESAYDR